MLTFVKFSNKYVPTILLLDFPCSCAIKYYSSRRESILSLYKPYNSLLVGRAPVRVLSPRRGRKILLYSSNLITFSKKNAKI